MVKDSVGKPGKLIFNDVFSNQLHAIVGNRREKSASVDGPYI